MAAEDREHIEALIREILERGSQYDTDALEQLYAEDLQIVRVAADGTIRVTDRADTLRFFRTMRESGAPPLSTAAHIRVTRVGDDRAHALVLREMQTEGMPRRLVFSIECTQRGGRWQVTREVAVAQS